MPVCPACGKANSENAQRCIACGVSLSGASFAAVAPATRRMGHTALGVAPAAPKPADGQMLPEPFAPVPATLAGPFVPAAAEPKPDAQSAVEPATSKRIGTGTLHGMAASNVSPPGPLDPSQTIRGFERGDARDSARLRAAPGTLGEATPQRAAPVGSGNLTLIGVTPGPTAEALNPGNATLVGGSSPTTENQNGTEAARTPALPDRTLLGMSPQAVHHASLGAVTGPRDRTPNGAASSTEDRKPGGELKRTILGIAAAPARQRDGDEVAAVGGVTAPGLARAAEPHRTMLGVAPGFAPQIPPFSSTDDSTLRGPSDMLGESDASPRHKGTLLGVAMPGIAPLQPGQVKLPIAAPFPPNLGAAAPEIAPPATGPSRGAAQGRLAWLFGIAAALLVLVVAGAVYLWWTAVHLTVKVTSNDSGAEQLFLTCSNCPDGTLAKLDSTSAQFKRGQATLELKHRLAIGINRLTLKVTRPNRATSETVGVTVPIDFRVTTSLAELGSEPPIVSVQLESAPNTKFVIEGRTYAVGANGSLSVPVDVSKALTGSASAIVPFEQRFAYEIVRDTATSKGVLVVRTGITALEVLTPGPMHVTPNPTFTLTGRTTPKAKLTANGHVIPVSMDGTFRQEMALSAPGSTKLLIRAQEPQLAPRLVELTIERVTNLRQRADELAQPLPSDFDSVSAQAAEKTDALVALRGEVVANDTVNALTRIAASTNCKRGSCLFSIRYGGPLALRTGSRLLTIGRARLTPRPNSPAERDLSIDAILVVEDTAR